MSIWDKQRRSRILNELKQGVTDIHCLNVSEIMNKYEQQQYNYVKSIAKSLERIAIAAEKIADKPRKLLKDSGPVLTKQANKVKYL